MNQLKTFAIAAVTAMALTTSVGATAASAAGLYSGATKLGVGTKIETTGTNAVLKAGFATIECGHYEMDGKIENAGGVGVPVEGNFSNVSFTECNATVHVLKKGGFVKHHIAGTKDATLTWVSPEITVSSAGVSCTFGGGSHHLGTVRAGSPAATLINAVLSKVAGGFLCANPASFTGTDTVTTPNPLHTTAS
jgi:hypothetical protein